MYIREDGQLLKSKIVATMGAPRKGIISPKDRILKFKGRDNFWDTFLKWFIKDNMFLIDIIRLNMAFFKPPGANEKSIIRWLRKNKNVVRNVALLGDLPGPKLRLQNLSLKYRRVKAGTKLELLFQEKKRSKHPSICLGGKALGKIDRNVAFKIRAYLRDSKEPLMVSLGDAVISTVAKVTNESLHCVVENAGRLGERPGVTLHGIRLELPSFLDKDKEALDFLIDEGYDWEEDFSNPMSLNSFLAFVGVSFVKNKDDILHVKRHIFDRILGKLRQRDPQRDLSNLKEEAIRFSPAVIAKIETPQAWDNIDEILDAADGAMVARGDLAKQIGPQNVPSVQKQLIRLCNLRGKPVITATEMMASMEDSPYPTRAEANDVFNAVLDGSDAIMLSGETSKGKYPFQAVNMMITIAETSEMRFENFGHRRKLADSERRRFNEQRYGRLLDGVEELYREIKKRLKNHLMNANLNGDSWLRDLYVEKLRRNGQQYITDRISLSACLLSNSGDKFKAILAPTTSGRTVRMLSRFRPAVKLIGAAHDCVNRRKMIISYGVCPINCGILDENGKEFKYASQIFRKCCNIVVNEGYISIGDTVIFTAGTPLFVTGTTNLIQIKEVET